MARFTAYAAIVVGLLWQIPHVQGQYSTPQPYELTSQGNISVQANELYRTAIESCYRGQPGEAPHGPEFLACLKEQVRIKTTDLNAVYNGTLNYLRSSRDQTLLLQSQKAWLQFRDSNCAFTRAIADESAKEEYFFRLRIEEYSESKGPVVELGWRLKG